MGKATMATPASHRNTGYGRTGPHVAPLLRSPGQAQRKAQVVAPVTHVGETNASSCLLDPVWPLATAEIWGSEPVHGRPVSSLPLPLCLCNSSRTIQTNF